MITRSANTFSSTYLYIKYIKHTNQGIVTYSTSAPRRTSGKTVAVLRPFVSAVACCSSPHSNTEALSQGRCTSCPDLRLSASASANRSRVSAAFALSSGKMAGRSASSACAPATTKRNQQQPLHLAERTQCPQGPFRCPDLTRTLARTTRDDTNRRCAFRQVLTTVPNEDCTGKRPTRLHLHKLSHQTQNSEHTVPDDRAKRPATDVLVHSHSRCRKSQHTQPPRCQVSLWLLFVLRGRLLLTTRRRKVAPEPERVQKNAQGNEHLTKNRTI